MQYVDVVVKNQPKFQAESYSYAIPPELLPQIKIGQLVLVDFHHSSRPGVIMAIKRQIKPELAGKLKPLKKIVCSVPLLQSWQAVLARWLADYYLVSLDRAVFSILPPPVKSSILNLESQIPTTNYQLLTTNHRTYFLAAPVTERLQKYLQLVQKAAAKNKQILVILPHQKRLHQLINLLTAAGQQPLIFTSQAAKTSQLTDWLKVASGQAKIILGRRGAVFAPLINPGLIIVDEPDNYAYKEEQAPRFWLKTVVQRIAKQRGINLLFGDIMPTVEDCYVHKIKPTSRMGALTIINVSNQSRPTISPPLAEKIAGCSGKILLYSPDYYRQEEWRLERFAGRKITVTADLNLPPVFALAVVLDLEANLNLPSYRAREETLRRLLTLGNLAKELIIQTTQPENSLFRYLHGRSIDFYQEELASRRRYFFPPFSRLVKITQRHNAGDCQDESQKIHQILEKIPGWQIFISSHQEIIIKIPADCPHRLITRHLMPMVKIFGNRWIIDPDPYF